MKELNLSMQKLFSDLSLTKKKCPWIKEQTLLMHADATINELEELKLAIKNNDTENLKEELGDVLMDAMFLLVIAEEQGISPKEVIEKVNEKLIRRKPWVFGDMKIKDKEEAIKMWNEIKKQEKEAKKTAEEMVDIVNDKDEVIKKVTRKDADKNIMRRRASRVMLFNSKNKILLQKVSLKKSRFPGCWDFGIAEGLEAGESYDSAAIRGLQEELGINTKQKLNLLFNIKYTDKITKRFYNVYSFVYDGKIKIDKNEVSKTKFVSIKELEKMLKKEKFIPASKVIFNKYLEEYNGSKN